MTTSKSTAPEPSVRRIVDPLGEIEALAKQLCAQRGGEHWEEFWHAAESHLTSGRSAGERTDRTRQGASSGKPAELSVLAQVSTDPVERVIAEMSDRFLTDHETMCLGYVLATNELSFQDGTKKGPLPADQASQVMATFAGEYPESFLRGLGKHDLSETSPEERAKFWLARREAVEALDEPLSYSSQNTIRRLRDLLSGHPSVRELRFVG